MSYVRSHVFANDTRLTAANFWTEARRLEQALRELDSADLANGAITPDLLGAPFTVGRVCSALTRFDVVAPGTQTIAPNEKRRVLTLPLVGSGIIRRVIVCMRPWESFGYNASPWDTMQLNFGVWQPEVKGENLLLNAPLQLIGGTGRGTVDMIAPWRMKRVDFTGGPFTGVTQRRVYATISRATSPTLVGGIFSQGCALTMNVENTDGTTAYAAPYLEVAVELLYPHWRTP